MVRRHTQPGVGVGAICPANDDLWPADHLPLPHSGESLASPRQQGTPSEETVFIETPDLCFCLQPRLPLRTLVGNTPAGTSGVHPTPLDPLAGNAARQGGGRGHSESSHRDGEQGWAGRSVLLIVKVVDCGMARHPGFFERVAGVQSCDAFVTVDTEGGNSVFKTLGLFLLVFEPNRQHSSPPFSFLSVCYILPLSLFHRRPQVVFNFRSLSWPPPPGR